MDKYEAIHGRDASSFDLTSTHRLPTISAAQALEDLNDDSHHFLPTGLKSLDRILSNNSLQYTGETLHPGGLQKGQVVDVWGPPGSGKSTFAMQVAINTLSYRSKVVWVDTFHPFCRERFREITPSYRDPSQEAYLLPNAGEAHPDLVVYSVPTLAHLIGLLCKPTASSVPDTTSLIVIDGLVGLVNHDLPRNYEPRQTSKGPHPSAKRLKVLQYIISALQKLAATRNLVVMLLTPCATKMQFERGAAIVPGINASVWEQGVATRLVLFRDWTTPGTQVHSVRIVGVQKNNGQTSQDGIGPVVAFGIDNSGIAEMKLTVEPPPLSLSSTPRHQKRKMNDKVFEVADSEGEDYGWEEDDDMNMPNMPPQALSDDWWQGSEDILLGPAEDDDKEEDRLSASEEA
ncbi:P-loop containing nucleoside triphosphate hydrolase protein [Xylariaceae sp. FL1272]|nr:P-loop containing nucleoside triphosphate hydrolase protein [Xylariaceae sp. FL1272]